MKKNGIMNSEISKMVAAMGDLGLELQKSEDTHKTR